MSITAENKEKLEKERRSQIQNAALKLFFENGYQKTTMADIAVEAGISKGLIYHYFKNKVDLLLSFREQYDACIAELDSYPTKRGMLEEFGHRLLMTEPAESGYVPPLQILLVIFTRCEIDDELYGELNPLYRDYARNYFAPIFKAGMENGEFKPGDPELYGDIYWHYLLGCLVELKQPRNNIDCPTKNIDAVLAMFDA